MYEPIRTTEDAARRLVVGQTRETHYMELKGLDAKGQPFDRPEKCARDVAQFANASGGSIVIGTGTAEGLLVQFYDVAMRDKLVEWVDTVLKEHLEPMPPIISQPIDFPRSNRLLVLNVPPSVALIARKAGKGYEFPIRAENSKRYMTLMEVEARMQDGERRAKLRLQAIRPEEYVVLDALTTGIDDRGWNIVRVDDDVVTLARGVLRVDVPLLYVQAVYRTPEQDVAWVIALSAHISRVGSTGYQVEHLRVRRRQD